MIRFPHLTFLVLLSILCEADSSVNVALDKPCTSSSADMTEPDNVVDGNIESSFSGGSCFHTDDDDMNPWWQVDLEYYYRVTDIIVTARSDACCTDRLHDFAVEVYMDKPPPRPPPPPPPPPPPSPPPPPPNSRLCLYYSGNVPTLGPVPLACTDVHRGRYVVVRGNTTRNEDDRLTICELEIYGNPAPEPCKPCTRYASLMNTRRNAADTLTPSFADTLDRCARECDRHYGCTKFNFSENSPPYCELILDEALNHVSAPTWTYYHRKAC